MFCTLGLVSQMSSSLGDDFCLVCGSPPPLFGERMCESCLRKRIHLAEVPENVPWVRCARCGIVEIQGKWVHFDDIDIWDELVQRHLKFHKDAEDVQLAVETRTVSDRHTLIYLQLEGVIEGLLFKEEHTMRARMANGVCLTCTRRAGNYFEATVQLRSSGRKLSEEEYVKLRATLDDVLKLLSDDPMFFITSEGQVTGGYDVVLGSKGLARSWGRHLVKEYGGQTVETNSTVGRKDGAIVERVDRQERTGASWRDLESANVVSRMSEQVVVDLITQDSSVGEFLDPQTWIMASVRLPWDHQGEKIVRLSRVEGEWIALQKLALDDNSLEEVV
jgi:NMD protein affecting ribosome stability and mRNA decay